MDLFFTPEEEAFRKELRDFLEHELPPDWGNVESGLWYSPQYIDFTKSMSTKLAQKGWLTLSWPKEYGGQDRSHLERLIYNEEMTYYRCPGTDLGVGATLYLGHILIWFGSEEQKQEHLPPITRAERYWCTLYSEPGNGSDLAGLQTRAEADGDDFVINGSKIWTSYGHIADWGWIATRTDPDAPKHRGVSMFVLDMKTPGITIRPIPNMTGHHEFNQIFFDNVRVPAKNLVGGLNRGWYVLAAALDLERSGVGSSAAARRTIEELVGYCKETERDGRPLSEDPIVRNKLVNSHVEKEAARWLAYKVGWMQQNGQIPNKEASMSKVFGSEMSQRLANVGMEAMGLYGQLDATSKWARLHGRIKGQFLRSFGGTIGGGTSEIQRNIVAQRGLGLPRQ